MQASLPDEGRLGGACSVYANAFRILRWLPRGCRVELEGEVSEVVREVVREEGRLKEVLSEEKYRKRMHQMPERGGEGLVGVWRVGGRGWGQDGVV